MNTKLVYVLVSTDKDIYLEQALLSIYSARYYNPSAKIILLVDNKTDATLQGKRSRILEYITSKKVIEIGDGYSNQQRSRLLKTTVREHIEGDFLFIDCDTIITTSLAEADSFACNMGAVPDAHVPLHKTPAFLNYLAKIDKKTGWTSAKETHHFNSGVLFVKDNPLTREFYKNWSEYYRQGMKRGFNIDQPAFAMANIATNRIVCELPGIWNCQLRYGLRYFSDSKIIHFCATDIPSRAEQPLFELMSKNVYNEIKQSGTINDKIAGMLTHPRDFVAEQTDILANKDVLIWNSETGICTRRIYDNFPRMFRVLDFISRAILYFDNHFFRIFKR